MDKQRSIDILTIGEIDLDLVMTIPYVPGLDEKAIGDFVGRLPGGLVANFACGASRLGLNVSSYCQVGDDEGGRIIIEGFEEYGIDTSLIEILDGKETPFTVILVDPSGEKVIIVVPTFKAHYYSQETAAQLLSQTRFLYALPGDEVQFLALAQTAHMHGSEVMIDIEPDTCAERNKLERVLAQTDIASFNQFGFVAAVGKEPSLHAAESLLAYGPHTVIVTRGSQGSLAVTKDEQAQVPGFAVDVVDTIGAGDTFHAAFLKATIDRLPLAERLRFANESAALSVTAMGSRGYLRETSSIEAFLQTANCS